MSFVYVVEDGSVIGLEGGVLKISHKNGSSVKVPKETIEGISIFGNSQMTTQCTKFCLERGIRVSFFSKAGNYFGRLLSTGHISVSRLKRQVHLAEDSSFTLELGKKIIEAKINNQYVVAKRYLRHSVLDMENELFQITNSRKKVQSAGSIEQIMGYEGIASRSYFKILSAVIRDDFKFSGRNRQPPKDPFNSMLSLGYTMVMYEIYGELENHGLNPYVGFVHQDREKHPTLASDMMEEWRAILVDSAVMSLVQGNEIDREQFFYNEENGGCFLTREGMKTFLSKMEKKLHMEAKYINHIAGRMSFRRAIWHQLGMLVRAIETGDVEEYVPLRIR